MPTIIDASSLPSTDGLVIAGAAAGDKLGFVKAAGDVNGDGIADIIVGAQANDDNGAFAGAAYVIFGKASGFGPIDLTALDPADGFKILGEAGSDGGRVDGALDFNNDGFDDVLINAPNAGAGQGGKVYLLFGKGSGFGEVDLGNLGSAGFSISWPTPLNPADRLHSASAGDVNGDGFEDILVSREFSLSSTVSLRGESYVIYGKASGFADVNLATLAPADGFALRTGDSSDLTGFGIAGIGDVNGDGLDDMLIGAPWSDVGGNMSGIAYVVYGRSGGFGTQVDLDALTTAQGYRITGGAAGDWLGNQVSAAGDVNGDGLQDFMVATKDRALNSDNPSAVYVIFGTAGERGDFDISDLSANINGTNGFAVITSAASPTGLGNQIAGGQDVNDDGFDDIVISADLGDLGGTNAGEIYVIYGRQTGSRFVDVANLPDSAGFIVTGANANDQLDGVAMAGDLNGDGYADILAGSRRNDDGGTDAGAAYVIYGEATPFAWNNIHTNSTSGATLTGTSAADYIIGNAGMDVLIGAGRGDRLYGLGGDDILRPGSGADVVYGGDGTDTVDYGQSEGAVYVSLGGHLAWETALTTGTVTAATPSLSSDIIRETENVIGSAYGDRLYGDDGRNLIDPGAGNDIAYGGGEQDRLSYASAAGGVLIDLNALTVRETGLTSGTVTAATTALSTDFVIGFEDAEGSAYGDRLYGDTGSNQLSGDGGDDIIYGGEGHDTLGGGDGDDALFGGAGDDTIGGYAGTDYLSGGADDDVFFWADSASGADIVLDFGNGADLLYFYAPNFGHVAGDTATLVANSNPVAAAPNSFLYDTDTGAFSFDADGAGGAAAILIATFQGAPPITAADIVFN